MVIRFSLLLVHAVIGTLATAIEYHTREVLEVMKTSELLKIALAVDATQDQLDECLDSDNPNASFIDVILSKQEEAKAKEMLQWKWEGRFQLKSKALSRAEFSKSIAQWIPKHPQSPVVVCPKGNSSACHTYTCICQAIAQECPESKDDNPMLYIARMNTTSIPSKGIHKFWTVTYYTIIGELSDGDHFRIRTRYRKMRELKDRLGLSKYHGFNTAFPSKQLFDVVKCFGKSVEKCTEVRRNGLEAWLNAVIQHIKENPTDECNPYRAREVRDFLTQQEEVDADVNEQEATESLKNDALEAQDRRVKAWREDAARNIGGECSISVNSGNITEWLQSGNFLAMEDFCPNYGKEFGWWGNVACPHRLADITNSVIHATSPCILGSGGLGGIPPIICEQYVMKVAKDAEVDPIYSLLYALNQEKKLPADKLTTLLSPVCRVMKVAHPDPLDAKKTKVSFFTVVPNLSIKNAKKTYAWQRRYDMKGNFNYDKKFSADGDFTLKDTNFWKHFPDGIELVGQYPDDGISLTELIVRDSKTLADLHHLDYSIFVHIVETKTASDLNQIRATHPNLPLAWGSHRNKTYAMAFGMIDLFMRNDMVSWKDSAGKYMTTIMIDSCTPFDIDPITPLLYRTRIAMMVGYHDPGPGAHAQDDDADFLKRTLGTIHHCGACYYRGPKVLFHRLVKGKDQTEFTYFRSAYQKEKSDENNCEWTSGWQPPKMDPKVEL